MLNPGVDTRVRPTQHLPKLPDDYLWVTALAKGQGRRQGHHPTLKPRLAAEFHCSHRRWNPPCPIRTQTNLAVGRSDLSPQSILRYGKHRSNLNQPHVTPKLGHQLRGKRGVTFALCKGHDVFDLSSTCIAYADARPVSRLR